MNVEILPRRFNGFFSKLFLRVTKTKFWGKSPEYGVWYYWILLADELVQAITERSVGTKFEEILSNTVTVNMKF